MSLNHADDEQKDFGGRMVTLVAAALIGAGMHSAAGGGVVVHNLLWLHMTGHLMICRIGGGRASCDMSGADVCAGMHGDVHRVFHAALDRDALFDACDGMWLLRERRDSVPIAANTQLYLSS